MAWGVDQEAGWSGVGARNGVVGWERRVLWGGGLDETPCGLSREHGLEVGTMLRAGQVVR